MLNTFVRVIGDVPWLEFMSMRREWLFGSLLAFLILAVYWPVRHFDYVCYDDARFVTDNPRIQAGLAPGTVRYALSAVVAGNWHPVTVLSHALDCEVFGVRSGAHHFVNVAFHIASAVLLLLLLNRVAAPGASHLSPAGVQGTSLFIAAFWALHPLRVESVAWVAERKDVLSGFFFLLTLWAYVKYVEVSRPRRPVPGVEAKGVRVQSAAADAGPRGTHPALRPYRSLAGSLGRSPAFWYWAALALFALGLMSKPMLVTLPFVLLLLDYWPLGRLGNSKLVSPPADLPCPATPSPGRPRRSAILFGLLREKVPFFWLSAIVCWVTLRVQSAAAGGLASATHISMGDRLANCVTSYLGYLGKTLWPERLAVLYPHPGLHLPVSDPWPAWQVWAGALLLVGITALLGSKFAVRRPALAAPTSGGHGGDDDFEFAFGRWQFSVPHEPLLMGWLWFLGMLVPVIGLVQVGQQAMADRYTYLPAIGLILGVVWSLSHCRRRREGALLPGQSAPGTPGRNLGPSSAALPGAWSLVVFVISLAVVFAWIILSHRQVSHWRNSVTLFTHTLEVTPDNPVAQNNLGFALMTEGQTSLAAVRYRAAVAIEPRYLQAQVNLAKVLREQGHWAAAAEHLQLVTRIKSDLYEPQMVLVELYLRLGRPRQAADHLEEGIRLSPDTPPEYLNDVAWCLATSEKAEDRDGKRAVQFAERACQLVGSGRPVMIGTLAAAYAEAGRFADAVKSAETALSMAAGDETLEKKNRECLEAYRAGKAWREVN